MSIWIICISQWGCQATRHLPPDELLLKNEVQVKSTGKLNSSILERGIRTKPNRRILVPKTFLHLHNTGLSLKQDSSWLLKQIRKLPPGNRFLNNTTRWLISDIGEPPRLINRDDLRSDSTNLRNICFAHGYFQPSISFEIDTLKRWFARQKANVRFLVKERTPAVIQSVEYRLIDSLGQDVPQRWRNFMTEYDTTANLIQVGNNYNHDVIARERARATERLRNRGYFTFSQRMIYFSVDSSYHDGQRSDDEGNLITPLKLTVNIEKVPPKHFIRHITIQLKASSDPADFSDAFVRTLRAKHLTDSLRNSWGISTRQLSDDVPLTFQVTSTLARKINYNFIARRVQLKEGSQYSQQSSRSTQRSLQELGMFQFAAINFKEVSGSDSLDVDISLQTSPHYQLKLGIESYTDQAITSSNVPVFGINLGLRNKNTFRQSELLELNFVSSVGFYAPEIQQSQFQRLFYELGLSANLNIPRFLFPGRRNKSITRLRPVTLLNVSGKLENRNEFNRLTTGLSLNYRLNHSEKPNHIYSQFTPFTIDFIDINIKDDEFREDVDNLPSTLQRDYKSRFSSHTAYSFTYSTYGTSRIKPTFFIRLNAEVGGNLPYLIDRYVLRDQANDNLLFLNLFGEDSLFYGQYVKGWVEAKYMVPLRNRAELVFRGLVGVSGAYNNTGIVPQESRFFSGGTNSMRGWRSNTLGPGKFRLEDLEVPDGAGSPISNSLLAPGGEIAMEFNAELRFDVYSYLKMAFFTDVGNVWLNPKSKALVDSNQETTFSPGNRNPGWDAGIGFRFDFSFLILRLDIAQQLYSPDIGWVLQRFPRDIGGDRAQFNLGIGYPF